MESFFHLHRKRELILLLLQTSLDPVFPASISFSLGLLLKTQNSPKGLVLCLVLIFSPDLLFARNSLSALLFHYTFMAIVLLWIFEYKIEVCISKLKSYGTAKSHTHPRLDSTHDFSHTRLLPAWPLWYSVEQSEKPQVLVFICEMNSALLPWGGQVSSLGSMPVQNRWLVISIIFDSPSFFFFF